MSALSLGRAKRHVDLTALPIPHGFVRNTLTLAIANSVMP